jgi:hypothetical protein
MVMLCVFARPAPSAADTVNPADVISGFWNIEWRRPGDDRAYDSARVEIARRGNGFQARGCHTVYRSPAKPNGTVRQDCGWRYGTHGRFKFDLGKITVREPSHVLGSFGGTTTISFSDGNTAQGIWKYERGNRKASGMVTWRRSMARISRVVLTSEITSTFSPGEVGRAKLTYDHVWTSGRGYREGRPKIAVEIYGTELWGTRPLSILKAAGRDEMLEIYDHRPIVEPVPGRDTKTRQIGVQFLIAVWRDAMHGPKRISFDSQLLPFDLQVESHPTLPRLTVVRAKTAAEARVARPLTTVPADGQFWFRAAYGIDPGGDAPKSKTLSVGWDGGRREIVLRRDDDDARTYLAGPFYGVFDRAPRPTTPPVEPVRALRAR